jgi:hypothetical protein
VVNFVISKIGELKIHQKKDVSWKQRFLLGLALYGPAMMENNQRSGNVMAFRL